MAKDISALGTTDSHGTLKGQWGTLGRSLQVEDPLGSVSEDSLDILDLRFSKTARADNDATHIKTLLDDKHNQAAAYYTTLE